MATTAIDVVQRVGRKATLQQQIETLGIPVLSWESVTEHKKEVLRKYRFGIRKFVSPLFIGIQYLLGLFTTQTPWMIWIRYRASKMPADMTLLILTLTAISLPFAAWAMHVSWWRMFFAVPLFAGCMNFVLDKVMLSYSALAEATSNWATICVTTGGENFGIKTMPFYVPVRLQRRAQLASKVSGVRISVDFLSKDPFLVAERGIWPFIDRVVIGAWNTGDKKFDSV
ncbi:MAG: hypothetical protein ACYC75_03150 [Minisyncoccota bacterium]